MQEYNVIIEIDEDGNIKAETKGMQGEVCINELDEMLNGLDGKVNFKNKPEFYKRVNVHKASVIVKKRR